MSCPNFREARKKNLCFYLAELGRSWSNCLELPGSFRLRRTRTASNRVKLGRSILDLRCETKPLKHQLKQMNISAFIVYFSLKSGPRFPARISPGNAAFPGEA